MRRNMDGSHPKNRKMGKHVIGLDDMARENIDAFMI
jgi:hypothetical protein